MTIKQFVKNITATLLTSSALCLALGIVLVIVPGMSAAIICYGLGAAGVVFGIVNIALYLTSQDQRSIIAGAAT